MSTSAQIRDVTFTVPERWYRLERQSLIAGVAGAILCIIAAIVSPEHFLRGYLVAYMDWLALTLGSLAIICLIHVTTAQWGFAVRRILEAAARNISLLTLLFIPIAVGMTRLYPWAHPGADRDFLTHLQRPYLNPGMWILRAVLYFATWNISAWALSRWSWLQDSPPDHAYRRRFQNFAAAAIVMWGWTMTFASVDWMMSLDNHWRSTIYGFYVMAGQGLSGFAFVIIAAVLLWRYRPISEYLTITHLHDMGKLMFAFLILWAYQAFSQGLIYWAANLKDEVNWYVNRTTGGWWWVGIAIILLHFFVPFFLLLSQDLKRDTGKLIVLAAWMLVMRWVDLYWLIIPNFPDTKGHFTISWSALAATIGIGGLWIYAFLVNLKAHPLVPRHDPMIYRVIEAQEHGH
ncbi:MAG TPA: hypothetical protein VE998_00660 [Terriglobales bacterium]|nr:hypothetical protein [Terriglobales bacterium]